MAISTFLMASPNSNNRQLELTVPEAEVLQKALRYWSQTKLVPASLIQDLTATVRIVEEHSAFDWDRFAKYTLRLSIICLAIAIFSLVFDRVIPNFIKQILSLPASLRIPTTCILAIAAHAWGYNRSQASPNQLYFNEAIHGLGALLFGLAAAQLVSALEANTGANRHILHNIELALAIVYGVSAVLVRSPFIWSCGLLVLGLWFGTWSAYRGGTYYLGMAYPLRFVVFGAALVAASSSMRGCALTNRLWSATRIWGMLYLFIALWMLSLFGNDRLFSGRDSFLPLGRPNRIVFWSIAFLCAAATAIWHGLRYGDSTTKGFGLTFLGINLFSKFFEFFWSVCSKSVFFGLVALSLGLVGRYAESVNAALDERYWKLVG